VGEEGLPGVMMRNKGGGFLRGIIAITGTNTGEKAIPLEWEGEKKF